MALLAINTLLLATFVRPDCLLLATCYLLPTAGYWLLATCYWLPTADYILLQAQLERQAEAIRYLVITPPRRSSSGRRRLFVT